MKHKSQAVSEHAGDERPNPHASAAASAAAPVDARIQRTRAVIDHAFVQLLFKHAYRTITVRDIALKAGVGRATFYAHYESKDQLLRSQLTRIILPVLKACPEKPYLLDCTALFDHVLSAPQLFRNIMSGGEGSGARVVRVALQERVEVVAGFRDSIDRRLPLELVTRFVVSTLLAVTLHALQSKTPESPAEMQIRFARLAGSGIGELA
ncbi:MAG TPA: TetR/AcrR family transcriptional regulator [Terracidiphilus sp.]